MSVPGKRHEEAVSQVEALLREYYKSYYLETLGLPDWKERVERGFSEGEKRAASLITDINGRLGYDFKGKKVLVAGAGTGEALFSFHAAGAQAYGFEPSANAREILARLAFLKGLDRGRIADAYAESIPFPEESFDFVFCQGVLERARDVRAAFSEMVRVSRKGGVIYLSLPEGLFCHEIHYDILCYPPALPFGRRLLIKRLNALGRPVEFARSLNFLSSREMETIIAGDRRVRVLASDAAKDCRREERTDRAWSGNVLPALVRLYGLFGIRPRQEIYLIRIA